MSHADEHAGHRGHHPGGPALALTVVAVLLIAIFQSVGVVREHVALAREHAAQQPAVEQGLKLRQQLRALAGAAAELARSGDAGARNVLAYMHREGVTIKPPSTPAGAASSNVPSGAKSR